MKSVIVGLVLAVIVAGQPDTSNAFDRRQFRFHGYVQWIAGEKLMLFTDDGAPIAIDLTEADQSDYQALVQGQGVTVGGVVKPPEDAASRSMPFLAFWIRRDRE